MRGSCGRTTWPDHGTNVNAGLAVKGNEEFGDDGEALYEVRPPRLARPEPWEAFDQRSRIRRILYDDPAAMQRLRDAVDELQQHLDRICNWQ